MAARAKHVAVAKLLIENGADQAKVTDFAVGRGCFDAIKSVLEW